VFALKLFSGHNKRMTKTGRPPIPPEQKLEQRSLRLTKAQWAKLALLGGAEWIRKKINAARAAKE
jgi:hypothetical protein